MNEKVSIVIPIFNSDKYLYDTLKSIQNQSYKNLEVLLIDDGSKDNSASICNRFSIDERFKYYFQVNSGAPTARNKGLLRSSGKYILFFDSDDLMIENAIEIMVKKIEERNSELVISNFRVYDDGKAESKTQKFEQVKSIYSLYSISPFPNNKLYLRSFLVENNLVFDNVKIGQDLNFFYRVIPKLNNYCILNDVTTLYRLTPNSISRSYDNTVLDIIKSYDLIISAYNRYGCDRKYYKYLYTAYVSDLVHQMEKTLKFKEVKEGEKCFIELNNKFKELIKERKCLLNRKFIQAIRSYLILKKDRR